MKHHENVKIIAFVGLTGSGKSTAVDYLTEKGYPKVYFGGIFYDAMKEAGLTPGDWAVENPFRKEIREKEGEDFIAIRAVKQIRSLIAAGQHRIVADGIYSWTEYKIMKHEFPGELTVVAVVSPKHLRQRRLANRPERPLTAVEVDQRDWAEIENIQKGGPIAIADYYILNSGDIDHFHQQIDTELEHAEFYS
ncbi:MAG TPA: AAA family ATPase [Candidatus Saccharimonadales bacterium]|nr:AAA family ATPase [Candidatus Saccharimonadales bacterium]